MTGIRSAFGIFGAPPAHLATSAAAWAQADARQLSPLYPGAADLAAAAPGSYGGIVMLAPAGTLERRYALALALGALAPGAELVAIAPKDKGGLRLNKELQGFGCRVRETSKNNHRLCVAERPETLSAADEAIAAGSPRRVEATGLWSQPGVFSWDRIDPGSRLLASRLPRLAGEGADLGCGVGVLSLQALRSADVTRMLLVDIDRRAIDAARRNVIDPRAHFLWADATRADVGWGALDFVVLNPPFHNGSIEDKGLGRAFIRSAAKALRPGGVCWLVANRHLPYEAELAAAFGAVRLDCDADGFKVIEAIA